jgi:serine O-acetyltransferase
MTFQDKTERALEQAIDEVAKSYALGRPIDSLETTALPNRRKIIEGLHHLEHVAFMGFYSTKALSSRNLRHYIAEHIHCAAGLLVEQIARAVGYARKGGGAPEAQDQAWSEDVVSRLFARMPAVRESLALDIQAAFDGDPAAKSIEEIVFSYPAVQAICTYRLAHELYVQNVPMVPRIMAEHAHNLTGIEIHPGARIGKRFFIDHGTGVVIGETSVLGDDVKLYQGVTLGALSMPRDADGELIREARRHPKLENGVTIYAGATILGGETVIGENSVIGSNVWITESVPPNTRVSYSASRAHATQTVQRNEG